MTPTPSAVHLWERISLRLWRRFSLPLFRNWWASANDRRVLAKIVPESEGRAW